MTEDMRSKLRTIMASEFRMPLAELPSPGDPRNIPAWDSYGHFELIQSIEALFKISIPHTAVVELLSEDAIIAYLHQENVESKSDSY